MILHHHIEGRYSTYDLLFAIILVFLIYLKKYKSNCKTSFVYLLLGCCITIFRLELPDRFQFWLELAGPMVGGKFRKDLPPTNRVGEEFPGNWLSGPFPNLMRWMEPSWCWEYGTVLRGKIWLPGEEMEGPTWWQWKWGEKRTKTDLFRGRISPENYIRWNFFCMRHST